MTATRRASIRTLRPTTQLHGFRDREMQVWPTDVYRDILERPELPKSQNAPREDQILFVDFASPTIALIKVRVRIPAWVFLSIT